MNITIKENDKPSQSEQKHDLLVFIGRFQPFHLGHKAVIERALAMSKDVLVLIGGEGKARSPRNPFTYNQRFQMITDTFSSDIFEQLHIRPIHDCTYDDDGWVVQVQQTVNKFVLDLLADQTNGKWQPDGIADLKIGLIGCKKDHTSYYLDLFPQWNENSVSVDFVNPLNATDIRNMLYKDVARGPWEIESIVPHCVAQQLFESGMQDVIKQMAGEDQYYKNYRDRFPPKIIDLGNGDTFKYEIMHHTVDAIVVQSGHVLMIQRRSKPGEGLWAIPGGFLNPKEKLLDGAIRELREETKLKVPEAVLRGSIKGSFDADDPNRSERGRIISKVFLFELTPNRVLPKVKAASDAKQAQWVPIADLREDNMFEDHYHLINKMLGIL